MSSTSARSLVYSDGSSHKFWKIDLEGKSHTVQFGRIGTAGQSQTKEFDTEDAARKSYDKLVAEKTKKGYVDAGGAATSASAKTNAATATTKPAQAKSASRKAAAAASTAEAPAAETKTAEPKPASAPAVPVTLDSPRCIDLNPWDWFRAPFRKLKPLERGAPREFSREDCLAKLAKLKTQTYGWDTKWADLNLPPALSQPEAVFWLTAMTTPRTREVTMKTFSESLAKKKIPEHLDLDEIQKHVAKAERGLPEEATLVLANLLSPADFLQAMMQPATKSKNSWQAAGELKTLLQGFRKYLLPYLPTAEVETLRKKLQKTWDPTQEPASDYDAFPAEFYVAAAIGMHDSVYQVVSRWDDKRYQASDYADHYQRPQDLLFGLASPEIIAAEWRRLKLKMRSTDDVRAFLACTEYGALDCIVDCINAESNKEQCEELLNTLLLVRAPEAAPALLNCKLSCKTPAPARDWLDQQVGFAVPGLIDTAGGKGKLADAAIDYLRGVKRRGMGDVIAAAVRQASGSLAAAKVQADVVDHEEKTYEPLNSRNTPPWLSQVNDALGKVKAKPVPVWAAPEMLPPILVGNARLNDEQVKLVIKALVTTPVTDKHPLLTVLREQVAKNQRDEFAWKLFQHWQEDGYSPKEKWAMGGIGHLGDDGCVLKLTPMIRVWPGESQHARAVFGLECLRAIGSSTALMNLSGIAQKLKFKGLKTKAEQFVTDIAQERGLTRDELQDRVVPDCGLDEQGRREFSFGPRTFSFVLGGDLKAMVKDEAGKLRPDLPAINAKDDQTLAAESVAEWKLLKKQIKEVATIQAGRLEQAMVTGRRWKADDFASLLVRHPLMTHLAQKLIWAGFSAKGKRLRTFRITEERDFADAEDNAVDLKDAATVGVVHPLELSAAEREQWGQVLGDYELVAPFPQLGRPIFELQPEERDADDLQRFQNLKLFAPTLVFTLEKLNWIRGVAMDAGCFDEHSKQFPAVNVTAVIGYEGTVGMGYIDPNEILTVNSVNFCEGLRAPSGYGWDLKDKKLKLSEVPPIVISEVIADLQVLKSKAK